MYSGDYKCFFCAFPSPALTERTGRMNIKVTSDSTCDLPKELLEQYNIDLVPLIIMREEEEFLDNVTITPNDIFSHVDAGGNLCTTAARSVAVYEELFAKYAKDYDGMIHISLGSGFSSSYQNASIAAQGFDNVRVVDSRNLSAGHGLVVLQACRLAEAAQSLEEITAQLEEYAGKVETSFVLDRLDYMVKGGRCSMVAALGANLLHLKPCIELEEGKMGVGKKYRGKYDKCLASYVKDKLQDREDIDRSVLLLVHTRIDDPACMKAVEEQIAASGEFGTVYRAMAGCTISCHCGPNTLGVIFARK